MSEHSASTRSEPKKRHATEKSKKQGWPVWLAGGTGNTCGAVLLICSAQGRPDAPTRSPGVRHPLRENFWSTKLRDTSSGPFNLRNT